jgi:hypothetical protein
MRDHLSTAHGLRRSRTLYRPPDQGLYRSGMPNGKPGDHPLTDIVVHRQLVFGEPIDALIAELDGKGLWASPIASEWLYGQYWDYREVWQRAGESGVRQVLDHLETTLLEEKQRLDGEAASGK